MIRKFFAGFLVFIFVLISAPIVLLFGIYKVFVDEDLYQNILFPTVYDYSLDRISEEIDFGEGHALSTAQIKDILQKVFTPNDLDNVLKILTEQFKSVSVAENGQLTFLIPLDWLIDKNIELSEMITDALSDELEFCEDPRDFLPEKLNCIPEGITKSQFREELNNLIVDDLFKNVPKEYLFTVQVPEQFYGKNIYEYYTSVFNKFIFIIFLLQFFILIFIGLVIYRPFVRIMKWESKAIFWAVCLPILSVFVIALFIGNYSIPSIEVYMKIYSSLFMGIFKKLSFYFGPIFFISLFLWIYMAILDNRNSKPTS